MKSVTLSLLQSAANAFDFGGPVLCDAHHYGEGHINDTFVVWREDHSKRFILQRINTDTFTNPVGLMENVCGVTRHLRAKILAEGGAPARVTLNVIPRHWASSRTSWRITRPPPSTRQLPASTTRPTAMPILKKPSPPMHWAGQKISRRKSNLSMRGSRTAMSCWISWQLAKFLCASPTMTPRSTMSSSMPLPEKASASLTSTP